MLKRKMSMILIAVLFVSLFMPMGVYAAKTVKAKSVTLSAKNVVLAEGDIVTLTATKAPAKANDTLKWSTSDKDTVIVSSKGVVTAVKEGTATVTVTTSLSKKKATCTVKVEHYLTMPEVKELIAEKKYITKDEADSLVTGKGYMTESATDSLVTKKGYVTKGEVESLLTGYQTETDVKDLIDAQLIGFSKLTLADVDAEIEKRLKESGFVTENSVIATVNKSLESYVTKTEVEKMIADVNQCECAEKYYTKAEVDKLVADSACDCDGYTKDEVDKMIADAISGVASNDWEDGTEVKLYKEQSLPLKMQVNYNKGSITVDSITIKKSHNNKMQHNYYNDNAYEVYEFSPFKYEYTMSGTYDCDVSYFETYLMAYIQLWNEDWTENGPQYIYLKNASIDTENKTFQTNGEFLLKFDAASFYIENIGIDG